MMNWAHMPVTNWASPRSSAHAHCRLPFGCMQLRGWGHDATHSHCDRTRGAINSHRLSIIAGSSRSNGRTGRTRRWRKSDDGRNARDVLGGLAMAMTAGIGWLVGAIA